LLQGITVLHRAFADEDDIPIPSLNGTFESDVGKIGIMKLCQFEFSVGAGYCLAREYASASVANNTWKFMDLLKASDDRPALCMACSSKAVISLLP